MKTVYNIQGFYSKVYGFETVCTEESEKEANKRLKEYNDNEPMFEHRIVAERIVEEVR